MSRPADRRLGRITACLLVIVWTGACSGAPTQAILTAGNLPLDLGEHLDAATIVGSEVPADPFVEPVEWRFDEPQSDWKAATPGDRETRPAAVAQTDDALAITIPLRPRGMPIGGVYVEVPAWDHRDWAHVVIRARSTEPGQISLGFNMAYPYVNGRPSPWEELGPRHRLVSDGTVQTYRLSMPNWALMAPPPQGPIDQLGLWIWANDGWAGDPMTVEILSIAAMPWDALYAEARAGRRHVEGDRWSRRSIFVHTPAALVYRVEVPDEGRLDTGLGTVRPEPTTFRVTVSADLEPTETLLETRHDDPGTRAQHALDLSAYAGQVVTLSLEADAARNGSIAFWGAPTLTAGRLPASAPTAAEPVDGFSAWVFRNEHDQMLRYRLFVPPDYDESRSYPLVLFLHGGGGMGTDNLAQISVGANRIGTAVWTDSALQARHPSFVLAPQVAGLGEGTFAKGSDLLFELLVSLCRDFSIDENRLYVTGYSMGGGGTYMLGFRHPVFAALVPMAAGLPTEAEMNDTAPPRRLVGRSPAERPASRGVAPPAEHVARVTERLAGIPIWIFHGELDGSVEHSRHMAAALEAAGADVRYTEFPGAGHGDVIDVVLWDELTAWMFTQRRGGEGR